MLEPIQSVTRVERITLWAGLFLGGVLTLACFVAGGQVAMAAGTGIIVAPFAAVALFAHLGKEFQWAEMLSWAGTGFILLLVYLSSIGLLFGANMENPNEFFVLGSGALTLAGFASAPLLVPAIRKKIGHVLGLQIDSPARHVGLFFTVALSLLLLAPVLSTGQAILINVLGSTPSDTGLEAGGNLLMLAWTAPLAFVLVGFGITRGAKQSLQRLGLEWRGIRSILAGLGVAITLAVIVIYTLDPFTELLADLGIPTLSEDDIEMLYGLAKMTPLAALALSITAGVGEELTFRGALQPRVGILLANCLFTAMHAWQYTLDGVLVVFLVGLCMAFLRRRFGTWSSITAHFTYDVILFMLAIA